jgi:ParB-like chromosome segregation protein Spo0J
MVEYRKLSELYKLEGNPRTIKDRDLAKLMQSIRDNPKYFEVRPLILSNRTGKLVILGGNQRYEASLALGLKEVPTGLIEGLTEEQEKEIVIRDNVNNGEWDWDLLANDWDSVLLDQWGVNVWIDEVSDLIEEKEPEPDKMKKLVFNLSESDCDFVKDALIKIDSKLEKALIKLIQSC